MKKHLKILSITLLMGLITLYSCSNDDNDTVQLTPVIKMITPVKGEIGTTVKVTGKHFGTSPDKMTFKFNGEKAKVISIKDTELQVEVPVGAKTGKVSMTIAEDKIEGPEFTVIMPPAIVVPSIISIEPTSGGIGTIVTVQGANFGISLDDIAFYFNETKAEVKSATDKKLEVIVPNDAKTGKVSVTTKEGKSEGPEFTVGQKAIIKKIKPTKGMIDAKVGILGTNFGETKDDVAIYFNDTKAEILEFKKAGDLDFVSVKVPSGSTTGKVSIITTFGKAEGPEFIVAEGPNITSVEPASAEPGTMITIKGTNFDESDTEFNTAFYFNGIEAKNISHSENELKVIVPPDATKGKVSISTRFGTAEGPNFTVLPRSGKDVYIVGSVNGRPVYWKNGEVFYLEQGISVEPSGKATAIAISGGDVHIAGHIGHHVVYWKNGKVVFSNYEGALVIPQAIAVSEGDVHIVAWTVFGINGMIYWKNGVREVINPSEGVSEVNPIDMVVVGSDVYIGGHQLIQPIGGGVYRAATYWKNGVPVNITDTEKRIWSEVNSIAVVGEDVYVAGYENNAATVGSGAKGKIWKNGKEIIVFDRKIIDMEVKGGDVHFITGSSYHKNNTLVTELSEVTSLAIDDRDKPHIVGLVLKKKITAIYRNGDGLISYLENVNLKSNAFKIVLSN